MKEWLAQYGLAAVFVGALVEGDGTLIVSGVLAHLRVFPFAAVLIVGLGGAIVSDHACYWLGRNRGPAIRASAAYARFGPLVERLSAHVGSWEIVAARFVLGTRNASMFYWGMRELPYLRFALLDLAGCVLWATAFTTLGYVGGRSAKTLLGEAERFETWLLAGLVLAAIAVVAARALTRRAVALRLR